MPASGRGANLDTSRRVGAPRRRREPPKPAPVNLRSTALPTQPFRPAQKQAQRKVEHAQSRLPREPTPHIPRLAKPTPRQTAAALTIAREHQRASGKAPEVYWREQRNDPRQRAYVQTVAHYVAAGHRQARAAFAPGRRERATRAPAPHGIGSLPIVGAVRNYLGERAAEDIPALAKTGQAIAKLGIGQIEGPHGLAGNALTDVANIGRAPLIAGIQLGGAAIGAAHGDLGPAKKFASDVAHGVEQGALGQLVQGHTSAALRALKEHPLVSPLEVAGVEGALGRTAGAVVRGAGSTEAAGGLRGALSRAGSTTRAPVAIGRDIGSARKGDVHQRTASKDILRSGVQHLVDVKTRKRFVDPETGKPITYTQSGRVRPVLQPRGGAKEGLRSHFPDETIRLQRKRGNEEQGKERDRELYERDRAARAEHEASRRVIRVAGKTLRTPLPKAGGRLETDLAHLFAEGVLLTKKKIPQHMAKRAAELEAQIKLSKDSERAGGDFSPYHTRKERKEAEHAVDTLRKALADPKVLARAPQIADVGYAYAKHGRAYDDIQEALGILDPYERRQSDLRTAAMLHHGARHTTEEQHAALEADVKARGGTRAEQIAVGGRDPELVLRHEAAKQATAAASAEVKAARTAVVKAREARARLKRGPTTKAGKAEKEARGAAVKAAEKRVTEAEKAHRKAQAAEPSAPERNAALRNADGTFLSLKDIEAKLRREGRKPDTLTYFPHKPGGIGKGAYHRQPRMGNRPISAGLRNTGALLLRGAHKVGRELVNESFHSRATTISRVLSHDKFIQQSGLLHPRYDELLERARAGGRLTKQERRLVAAKGAMTADEARRLQEHLIAEGHDYKAVKLFPAKLSKENQRALLDEADSAHMESVHKTLLKGRLLEEGSHDKARNYAVVPGHLFERHEALTEPAGRFRRLAQQAGKPFRIAVLAQPKWLTGDFFEPQLVRLSMVGGGLVNVFGAGIDLVAMRKIIKSQLADPDPAVKESGHEFAASVDASIGVTGRRDMNVRRTYEDQPPGAVRTVLKVGSDFYKLPPVKALGQLALAVPRTFFGVNSQIGKLAKAEMLGKNVRMEIQEHTGSWWQSIKLSKEAIDDVKKGLIETPAQVRFAEQEIAALGRYNGYGPAMKSLTQTITPFIPWVLNSIRFVYWTLPAHHSTLFLALQKEGEAVLQSWEEEHADLPPGELRDAVRARDGGVIPISKYLPEGATEGFTQALLNPGDSKATKGGLRTLTSAVAPQLSGFLGALGGQDFLGEDLKVPPSASNPKGTPDLGDIAKSAANALGGSFVPNYNILGALAARGGTPYSGATVPEQLYRWIAGKEPLDKPGTKRQGTVNRAINPLREVYTRPKFDATIPADAGSTIGLTIRQQAQLKRHAEQRSTSGLTLRQKLQLERASR